MITAPSFKDAVTFNMGRMESVGDVMVLVVGSTPSTLNVLVWRVP